MQLEGSGLLSAQPKKTGKEPGTWTGDNSDQWGHHQDRSGGLSDTVGPSAGAAETTLPPDRLSIGHLSDGDG